MKKIIRIIQAVLITLGLIHAQAEPAMDLQWFADAGTLVNATGRYQNAYNASDYTAFSGTDDLSPTMKIFYDTRLLDNSRPKLIYAQLGRKESLPANHGRTLELRRMNTLSKCTKLTEGVIPTGKKLGMTSVTIQLTQWGDYVAITDLLELHAIDNILAGATEELGAAAGLSNDILVRNVLLSGTNILFADAYNGSTYVSTPTSKATLLTALASYKCDLTPDMIAKAVTNLKTNLAPTFEGNTYVAVVHPHVAYDIRKHPDWLDAHKYSATREIFEGEIGELHGCRFIESTNAPVIKAVGDSKATYKTMFFGKDAFAVLDPEGGGMESIYMSKEKIGGPLKQFSTMGTKFEMGAKILYQERMVTVWSGGSYSATDTDNDTTYGVA